MRANRPFIYLAICGALLGSAAACNNGSSSLTGVDEMNLPDDPVARDTTPMIPPSPVTPGR